MSFVSVEQLDKSYGATSIFRDIDFAAARGEFVTLLGPSGCGKSTLLRCIAGLTEVDSGRILIDGEDVVPLPPQKRGIAMVFQSYALFPNMTVQQNVAFGLRMQKVPAAELKQRVAEAIELVELGEYAARYPHQLSGGQCQRVALARSLVTRPRLLLLDEPLSALDARIRKHLREQIRRIQQELGLTTVFVTHDQEEALTMSDRIAVMSKGKVLQVGTPSDIYEAPLNRAVADFIGETNFLEGQADADGVRLADGQRLAATTPGSGAVTLAIRPERTELAADGQLEGVLENIVYVGTDTVYHLNVAGQPGFRVRQQNRDGARCPHSPGAKVRVRIPAAAIRVLAE
ncbi:ABC transporter ATP-binding protein [Pseudomonas aeruginosa]|uniref:ABC transporter ATP-binding protein n=22 Tax=Gammaproteobacteria TaxID=1236 RepID=UPI00069CF9BD|nr:ABC transporter ATP-binding protein [Pseudomonas aeruginosa]